MAFWHIAAEIKIKWLSMAEFHRARWALCCWCCTSWSADSFSRTHPKEAHVRVQISRSLTANYLLKKANGALTTPRSAHVQAALSPKTHGELPVVLKCLNQTVSLQHVRKDSCRKYCERLTDSQVIRPADVQTPVLHLLWCWCVMHKVSCSIWMSN